MKLPRFFKIIKESIKCISLFQLLDLIRLSLFRDNLVFVYVFEVFQKEENRYHSLDSINIRKGTIAEIEEIGKRFKHVPWEFQCYKYDGVKDFFIASNSEGIQHISWIYYREDPNRFIKLEPDEAEIKYCLTFPPFRGKGIFPKTLIAISQYLKEIGIHRVFICVDENNHSSIRGIEKAGFKKVGRLRVRKFMGIQISKRYIHRAT